MASPANKSEARLDFRIDPHTKSIIEHAAELTGQSLTAFATSTLIARAHEIVAQHERVVLSDRDRNRFLTLLDKGAEPNQALTLAVKSYKKRVRA